jgi:hypothetical protein
MTILGASVMLANPARHVATTTSLAGPVSSTPQTMSLTSPSRSHRHATGREACR